MTPDQLPLLDVPATPKLTDRQARALAVLQQAGQDGMKAIELGRALGATTYAKQTGLELARALKKKGVACQRRGGVWVAAQPDSKPDQMPSGMTDVIPY